ncbi:N-acetylmuramoyl-L-alanine amidase [bacterium]|nr:N-acetylmuramoyl-L-alanine amidase [bacterium]
MKKIILIIGVLGVVLFNRAYALQIVYPGSNNAKINSPLTAFIGNETKTQSLKINGEAVKIHPSGGFKHAVKLKYGENIFNITNGIETKTYKITRPYANNNADNDTVQTTYNTPIIIITTKDNTPLRSTPTDTGLNRLQHLQTGICLKAVGEYKSFYKVQLARDDYAWISKSNTERYENSTAAPAIILSKEHIRGEKYDIYKFTLNKKVPYVLSEVNNGYDFTIYGLDGDIYPFNRYEQHINADKKKFGYSANYTDNNTLTVKINKFIPEIKNITITIDAGHGGSEKGTTGCLGDKEKDFNLKVAQKLEKKLKALGANTVMTRTDDTFIGLQDRIKVANDNNSQLFISIHANALPDSLLDRDTTGTEVYYFYPQAKDFAQKILSSINEKTGNSGGKIKAESFAVVRNTNAVSILLETGYMINPEENSKLITDEYQEKITDGIVKGIERFLNDI